MRWGTSEDRAQQECKTHCEPNGESDGLARSSGDCPPCPPERVCPIRELHAHRMTKKGNKAEIGVKSDAGPHPNESVLSGSSLTKNAPCSGRPAADAATRMASQSLLFTAP